MSSSRSVVEYAIHRRRRRLEKFDLAWSERASDRRRGNCVCTRNGRSTDQTPFATTRRIVCSQQGELLPDLHDLISAVANVCLSVMRGISKPLLFSATLTAISPVGVGLCLSLARSSVRSPSAAAPSLLPPPPTLTYYARTKARPEGGRRAMGHLAGWSSERGCKHRDTLSLSDCPS